LDDSWRVRGGDPNELVGQVLDSRYRVDALLGSGAMGSVYRARHVRLPRSFAIKLLHPRLLSDAKIVKRFEREARLAGKLSHPNVVAVLDVGEVDGVAYMVMELAVGRCLSDLLEEAPFERARAIRILRQLCDGLEHAHYHGLVHRDLKPENVIVELQGDEEVARIVDFGIAILREGADDSSTQERVTTGGIVLGTPHYMAPELATGCPFDHRVDLFALGVISYELLTGRMPFRGSGVEVLHSNIREDAPPMAVRAPGIVVDSSLEAFTRQLLARRPEARFPTAAAARQALDHADRASRAASDLVRAALASTRMSSRHITPLQAQALGSAETIAMSTLERPATVDEGMAVVRPTRDDRTRQRRR
jgi:serine/threonine-protein kinase